MATLYTGVFMAALDTAVIGPAIPALRATFDIDNRAVGLVMIVFVLVALTSTALMANLSDRHGRRPVYLASVTLFALGSLVIALSPRYWMVLAGRALQGLGAGGIIPTASAVIGDVVPLERQGRALGMIGAIYGMAFVLGPPLAAGLMVAASWHWIFLANLPIAALILVLGVRVLPARTRHAALPPLDVAGLAVVFLLLCALVLAITRVVDTFTGAVVWPWCLAFAVVLLPVLVRIERRAAQPMIPLTLFANRRLATAYVLTVGAGFGMGSVVFLTSIVHLAYGVAPDRTGFWLLPLVVCSMAGSMGGGRMLNRTGSRLLIIAGFVLLAAGYGAASVTGLGITGFVAASVPIGLGVGVVVGGALRLIAIDEAPAALRGTAQGLVNIANSIGTLLSAAIIAAIADFGGGDAHAFGIAYLAVMAAMLAMLGIAFTLRADRGRTGRVTRAAAR
ncbi:MAG: MFS transporter [Burkholderiales bacterium]